jgi:hypothetical protein
MCTMSDFESQNAWNTYEAIDLTMNSDPRRPQFRTKMTTSEQISYFVVAFEDILYEESYFFTS